MTLKWTAISDLGVRARVGEPHRQGVRSGPATLPLRHDDAGREMYLRDPAPGGSAAAVSPSELLAILLAVIGTLHIGLFPARIFALVRLIV